MKTHIIEICGWLGVGMIIGSYGLLSLGVLSGSSITYHTLVLTGSISVAVISYRKKARQPMILNVMFAFFALAAIVRLLFFSPV